jgi:hypothetical protein
MLIVNCINHGWGFLLLSVLERSEPAELINVDFQADRKPIEELSKVFGAPFEHDPQTKTVRFRSISNYDPTRIAPVLAPNSPPNPSSAEVAGSR